MLILQSKKSIKQEVFPYRTAWFHTLHYTFLHFLMRFSICLKPIPSWIFLTLSPLNHLRILFPLLSPVSSTSFAILFFLRQYKHAHVSSVLKKILPWPHIILYLKPHPLPFKISHFETHCDLASASLPFPWNCFHWGQIISQVSTRLFCSYITWLLRII